MILTILRGVVEPDTIRLVSVKTLLGWGLVINKVWAGVGGGGGRDSLVVLVLFLLLFSERCAVAMPKVIIRPKMNPPIIAITTSFFMIQMVL